MILLLTILCVFSFFFQQLIRRISMLVFEKGKEKKKETRWNRSNRSNRSERDTFSQALAFFYSAVIKSSPPTCYKAIPSHTRVACTSFIFGNRFFTVSIESGVRSASGIQFHYRRAVFFSQMKTYHHIPE
jgi:hypothetical protein